jgi:hypothetical protein
VTQGVLRIQPTIKSQTDRQKGRKKIYDLMPGPAKPDLSSDAHTLAVVWVVARAHGGDAARKKRLYICRECRPTHALPPVRSFQLLGAEFFAACVLLRVPDCRPGRAMHATQRMHERRRSGVHAALVRYRRSMHKLKQESDATAGP